MALDVSLMLASLLNNYNLKMTRVFHAKYRWCVTETTIADNLNGALALICVQCPTDGFATPWKKLCPPTVCIGDLQ